MVPGMLFGLRQQRALQRHQTLFGTGAGLAHPEAEIGRHLIVARARRVQPPRRRADDLGQPALDIEMDVFEGAAEGEGSGLDFRGNLAEPAIDGLGILGGDDALLGQHCGMGARSGQILSGQPFVEFDGGVYLLHDGGRSLLEAAAPHCVRTHRCRLDASPRSQSPVPQSHLGLAAAILDDRGGSWGFYM